jgi:hypothetical protein
VLVLYGMVGINESEKILMSDRNILRESARGLDYSFYLLII